MYKYQELLQLDNIKNNKISFQGQAGAYSEVACLTSFPDMETFPCDTFEDAFDSVTSGKAKLAMIPIENSQAGRVADIHNLLASHQQFYLKF